jgi:hypothetical protein
MSLRYEDLKLDTKWTSLDSKVQHNIIATASETAF